MASPESTHDLVIALLRQHVAPEREVTAASDLVADLGLDSVGIVEILGAVEERFAIHIADEALAEVARVGDLIRVVDAAGAAAAGPPRETV
jgi:acyl carrier protein